MRSTTLLVAYLAAAIVRADPKIESQDIPQQCQQACSPLVQLATQCWNQYLDRDPTGEEACLCNSANAGSFNACDACTIQYPTYLNGHTDGKGPDNDVNKVTDWSVRCRFRAYNTGMNPAPMPIGGAPGPDGPGKIGGLDDHDNDGIAPVVGAVPNSAAPVGGASPNSPAPVAGAAPVSGAPIAGSTPMASAPVPMVTVICGRPPHIDDHLDRDGDLDGDHHDDRDGHDGPGGPHKRDNPPNGFDNDGCYTTTLYGPPGAGASAPPATGINGAPIPTSGVFCDNDNDGDADRCTSLPPGFAPTPGFGTTFTRMPMPTASAFGSVQGSLSRGAAGAVSASVFYVGAGLIAAVVAVL